MSESRIEKDFIEWLSGASFEVGYARYGQLGGHGFVAATAYDFSDTLRGYIHDLDGGDIDALYAADYIESKSDCWHSNDPHPVVAMNMLVNQLREYYYKDLNNQAIPEGE